MRRFVSTNDRKMNVWAGLVFNYFSLSWVSLCFKSHADRLSILPILSPSEARTSMLLLHFKQSACRLLIMIFGQIS